MWIFLIILFPKQDSFAFVGTTRNTISTKTPIVRVLHSTTSDDDDNNNDDDDALSKLIGKRDSIRKKKDVISKPPSSIEKNIPIDDLSLDEILGGRTGMEVFDMPDFKIKRPLLTRLDDETKDKSRGGPGTTQENEQDKFIWSTFKYENS